MFDRPASGPPFDTSVVLPVSTRHCYAYGAWGSLSIFFLMWADKAHRRSPHASADHPGRGGGRRAKQHGGAPSRARGHLAKPTHPRCRRGRHTRLSATAGAVAAPNSTGRRPARPTAHPGTLRTAVGAPLHRPDHGGHVELRAPRPTRQPPTCATAHCISLCARPPPPPRRCTFPTGPTAPAPTPWRQRRASPPLGCRPR